MMKGQRGFDLGAASCGVPTAACRGYTSGYGYLMRLFTVQRAPLKEARMLGELLPPTGDLRPGLD